MVTAKNISSALLKQVPTVFEITWAHILCWTNIMSAFTVFNWIFPSTNYVFVLIPLTISPNILFDISFFWNHDTNLSSGIIISSISPFSAEEY